MRRRNNKKQTSNEEDKIEKKGIDELLDSNYGILDVGMKVFKLPSYA
jgi:hypothetical protein